MNTFFPFFVVPWIVSTYIRDRQRESRVAQRRGEKAFCRFGNRSAEKKEKREGKKAKKKKEEKYFCGQGGSVARFFLSPSLLGLLLFYKVRRQASSDRKESRTLSLSLSLSLSGTHTHSPSLFL
jgi:hypothetical protein